MKIILVGYMTSGKSTIGKLISEALHVPFFDLDTVIEDRLQMKIDTIFEKKGELYFRKQESEVLSSFIAEHDTYVLALGGGTPCYYNNWEQYQSSDFYAVYLKASITTILDRLQTQKQSRPLVASLEAEALQEFVAKHVFERSYYYNQTHATVIVDHKSESEIVSEILSLLT